MLRTYLNADGYKVFHCEDFKAAFDEALGAKAVLEYECQTYHYQSRSGIIVLSKAYLECEKWRNRKMKYLSVDERRSLQSLLGEAITDLLDKYNR